MIDGTIARKTNTANEFVAEHTIMNKVTGAVLFVFPLTLSIVDLKYSGSFICTIAILAAVQEGYLIRTEKYKSKRNINKSV